MKFFFNLLKVLFSFSLIINLMSCVNNTQPNIVLIMVDDLNDYPEIFNGHPQAKTPNIKKLANNIGGKSISKASSPMVLPSFHCL